MTYILTLAVGIFLGWFFGPWIDDKITPEDEPVNQPKPVKPSDIWGW